MGRRVRVRRLVCPMARQQVGAGLLEVLVAVLILSIGVLALGRFQGTALMDAAAARNRDQALSLARGQLAILQGYVGENGYEAIETGADADPVVGASTHFSRHWEVVRHDDPPYKTVTVVVVWTGMRGEPRELRLQGHIGQRSPVRSGELLDQWQLAATAVGGDPEEGPE